MRFTNVDKIKEFIDTVETCKGSVYVLAKNGEYLDLKEWLPSLKILIWTFNPKGVIKEMQLTCDIDEDMQKIIDCIGLSA